MLDAGDDGVRDGGLLARARAAPRRRRSTSPSRSSRTSAQDHLDFHPDMETYFRPSGGCSSSSTSASRIVDVDDAYGRRLAAASSRTPSTFALDGDGGLIGRATAAQLRRDAFTVRSPADGESDVRAAAARALQRRSTRSARWARCARARACPRRDGGGAARARGRVPGRFQPVDEGQAFAVLVDYSHKPDALEKVLRVGARARDRARADRRVRRRRGPRPRQAAAHGRDRGADGRRRRSSPPTTRARRIPRRSSPRSWPASRRTARGVERDVDRRAAIGARDRGTPQPGDVVVIAGKGHEQGQEFEGGRKEPFDDVDGGARGAAGGGARVRHWTPSGSRARPAPSCCGARRRRRRRPRVVIDSRADRARRPVRRAPRRAGGRRVVRGRGRWRRARGACWSTPEWAGEAARLDGGAVLAADDPVPALGALARAWRRDLAAHVIGVTGSVGKTSTKDLIAALIAPHRAVAANRPTSTPRSGSRSRCWRRRRARR